MVKSVNQLIRAAAMLRSVTMGISISAAAHNDVHAFVESVAGLFEEDGARHDPFMAVDWPQRDGTAYYAGLVDDPACLLLLARDGDQAVGHLVGKLVEPGSLRVARFAVLESMRVAPQWRCQRIGGQLVAAFFAWAHERGAVQASVSAFAANQAAQRFYARHGFTQHTVTFRAAVP